MNYYFLRKNIRLMPGQVMKLVPLPDPEIIEGFGKRSSVGKICADRGYKSVLVVTDKTLSALGFYKSITDSLDEKSIKYTLFCDISGEPDTSTIEKGRKLAGDNDVDCIVALGGGSVLDSSKVISASCKHKRKIGSYLHKFAFVKPIPLIMIPSTAGTGAEISVGAVVKNDKHVKKATVMVGLKVPYVILDSELTVKTPVKITLSCGIDALSHGLEGCLASVKTRKEDLTKSKECVKLVFDNLLGLKDNPEDVERRQALCRAANYGGNAINKQLAGYVHAFAHTIGGKYNISHGEAIAYSLYPVINFFREVSAKKIDALSVYCNISSAEDDRKTSVDKFMRKLKDFLIQCGFGGGLSVIDKKDYKALVKNIDLDSVNYSSAKTLKDGEIENILDEIKRGLL